MTITREAVVGSRKGVITIRPFRMLKQLAAVTGLVIIGAQVHAAIAVLAFVFAIVLMFEVDFDPVADPLTHAAYPPRRSKDAA